MSGKAVESWLPRRRENPRQGQSHREVAVAVATSQRDLGEDLRAPRTVMRKAFSLVREGGPPIATDRYWGPSDWNVAEGCSRVTPRYAATGRTISSAILIGPLADNSPASEWATGASMASVNPLDAATFKLLCPLADEGGITKEGGHGSQAHLRLGAPAMSARKLRLQKK